MGNNGFTVPVDTSWFDNDPERYLQSEAFQHYQQVSGVDLRDLLSSECDVVVRAQRAIAAQSVLFNETRNSHSGFSFPFLVYTHCLSLCETPSRHNLELDQIIFSMDMCDSLRRRHMALSHAILPDQIRQLCEQLGRPIVIKNPGSGAGLEVLNAVGHCPECVERVINYDTSTRAIMLGRSISSYLEREGLLKPGVVHFHLDNMMHNGEKADLIIMVGIICGLKDRFAQALVAKCRRELNRHGRLVVSSSNMNMESQDPLASFMIQRIGSEEDPFNSWGLNFRSKERLDGILRRSKFSEIEIFDDANFSGRDTMPEGILYGIDPLPAVAFGQANSSKPLGLPARDILEKRTGYNWIAVAKQAV